MNGKNKTNKILIGIIICLIAVIIGGAIYFTRGTDKDKENKTPGFGFRAESGLQRKRDCLK